MIAAAAVAVPVLTAEARGGAHPVAHQVTPTRTAPSEPAHQAFLDPIAQAIGDQGRRAFADTYSDLVVDSPHDRVLVYVTSLPRGRRMLAAAQAHAPGLDFTKAALLPARFTRRAVDAQLARIMTPTLITKYDLSTASAAPDGSGIEVTTAAPAADPRTAAGRMWLEAARRALQGRSGIPVSVAKGPRMRAATTAAG